MVDFESMIASTFNIASRQVKNTIELLTGGATIPFISRYRKEVTGGLNEVQIEGISNEFDKLTELVKRKETILSTIEGLGKLNTQLKLRIEQSWNATELEDLYLPYKPKRRTRAEAARQRGLEPLASLLLLQHEYDVDKRVKDFVKEEVTSAEDALAGARDIIAEQISEDEETRGRLRNIFRSYGFITAKEVKGKEDESQKYRDYFEYSKMLKHCSSHNLLALRRGESEGFLRVKIDTNEDRLLDQLQNKYVRAQHSACGKQVMMAIDDGYKRLLKPAIESEFAVILKEKADDEAIAVFAENLKQLLLAPPLGQKNVMAIDPGFRTGCKVVCLDNKGELLCHEVIFPHPPHNKKEDAAQLILRLVDLYHIEAFAIGDGTAGRETETFVRSIVFPHEVQIFIVSENGASIYSASALAREEFPKEDVTVRGAVSIGRRLMDPLAELVKIDPKSIGVGQYQHDVNQVKLKKSLDQTVINAVNLVGVNLNTASRHLLTYISGLGPQLAQNLVDFRRDKGSFQSRRELLKVPRMGAKAFEQCAGFLRISDGKDPLDNSAVHPERYALVEQMSRDLRCTVQQLIESKDLREKIDLQKYATSEVGMPTLADIMKELEKPGRDPRKTIEMFAFDPNIKTFEDLHEGMELLGIVNNITNFGCFVNIGIHENGLIHVSQMANRRVTNPSDIVSLHQAVKVRILGIDQERRRIQLKLLK
jgi:protein Tex